MVAPATEDIVKARDQAILGALKLRPWPEGGLLTVLPDEPTLTLEQKQAALHSALIRLRVKGLARCTEGVWRAA
jgi:hypothetical protein